MTPPPPPPTPVALLWFALAVPSLLLALIAVALGATIAGAGYLVALAVFRLEPSGASWAEWARY